MGPSGLRHGELLHVFMHVLITWAVSGTSYKDRKDYCRYASGGAAAVELCFGTCALFV